MKRLLLSTVTIQITAVIYDDETNTAEPVPINPLQVAAKDWPQWLIKNWTPQWEQTCKQVNT